MTVTTMTPAAPFGAITTFRAISRIERLFVALRAWHVSRKTGDQLSRLSDHELADIGLHRGWIDDVAKGFAQR